MDIKLNQKLNIGIRIIIVNYRTADLVIDCLRSLTNQLSDFSNLKVVVVDNNSGDDSVIKLIAALKHEDWLSWSEILALDRNGGFAFGNNASIRTAITSTDALEYIMLLNPDTVTYPGAIKSLVDFMEIHRSVGIAGSRLEDIDGEVDCSAHNFHSPLSQLVESARLGALSRLLQRYIVTPISRNVPHPCDWVSGASMIIRRKVVEDIGLMDEGFFLYFEEVDYCLRAHKAGWACWYVPDSRVMHLEGASTGIQTTSKRRAGYWYDSRRRFFVKHYGVTGLILADLLWLIGRITFLIRKSLNLNFDFIKNDPKRFMVDLLWGDIKAILSGQVWLIRKKELKQ